VTPRARQHTLASVRPTAPPTNASLLERLLHAIGADPQFADAVLGDLAEEHTLRAARDGDVAARAWYVREVLRSAPHLIRSALRHAARHSPARLALFLAGIAFVPTVVVVALLLRNGPPAQLVAADASASGGIVVNHIRPVQLAMRVLDAAGHVLKPATGVQYRWTSGTPVPVTPGGVVTCTQRGDATVHVSLGPVATSLLIHCLPVGEVHAPWMMNLVVGGPGQEWPFEAVGVDGRPVTLMTGRLAVSDSTIATLEGQRVRARAQGSTELTLRVGDREAVASVHAYEQVGTLEAIRPDQHLAVPVRVAGGEMREWRLPPARERYYITMLPNGDPESMPRFAIVDANCVHARDLHSFYCVSLHGATVTTYHPQGVDPAQKLSGTLAVWRQAEP
jgi:hypothetical protein